MQTALEQLDGLDVVHFAEHSSEPIRKSQLLWSEQQFFSSCSASADINSGLYAAVNEFPVQVQFHVARGLEFLEYDLVHFGACIDKGGREDGQ